MTDTPFASENGANLLEEIALFLRRFVVLSDAQIVALALWVLHTWAFEACTCTPYVHVTSAEKRCGKTRLEGTLAVLIARPLRAATASPAALFRSLAASPPPTLLMDEVDALLGPKVQKDNEDLRALLNAEYQEGVPVLRCVGEGKRQKVEPFSVFSAKTLAGIGQLPDTIADRCIRIVLKRRKADEPVERFRRRAVETVAATLRARARPGLPRTSIG